MHKIFKYRVDRKTGEVLIPVNARILRAAHVDDGFYKGDFIWAIVNTDWSCSMLNMKNTIWMDMICDGEFGPPHRGTRTELKVKEKQTVMLSGEPFAAHEDDGKIYVHHDMGSPLKEYQIAVYKTGQAIDLPVEKLQYIGLNRLWIIQELGLYTFVVRQ